MSPGSKIEGTSFPGRVAVVVGVVLVGLGPFSGPVQEAIRIRARATEPLVT
jgi:hypothetical protein